MMRKILATALVLPGLIGFAAMVTAPAPARASTDEERAAVMVVVSTVFDAIAKQDPRIWRMVVLDDGLSVPAQAYREGGETKYRISRTPNDAMAARLKPDGREYRERFTATPTVLIRGPIAVVWGEYDFWIDDTFSHCGVDSIDLVKIDGEWKIVNLMWTMETENCPTAPKGHRPMTME